MMAVMHGTVPIGNSPRWDQAAGQEDDPAKEVSGWPVEIIAAGDGALLGVLWWWGLKHFKFSSIYLFLGSFLQKFVPLDFSQQTLNKKTSVYMEQIKIA